MNRIIKIILCIAAVSSVAPCPNAEAREETATLIEKAGLWLEALGALTELTRFMFKDVYCNRKQGNRFNGFINPAFKFSEGKSEEMNKEISILWLCPGATFCYGDEIWDTGCLYLKEADMIFEIACDGFSRPADDFIEKFESVAL